MNLEFDCYWICSTISISKPSCFIRFRSFFYTLLEKHIGIYTRNNDGVSLSGSLSNPSAIWIATVGELSPHTPGFRPAATNVPTTLCKCLQELWLKRRVNFLQTLETFWLHHSCTRVVQFTRPYEAWKNICK